MAGAKETPRQKMIGLMYLVLMALLALNVSKDILEAFVTINTGLENTVVNFEKKNGDLYRDFDVAKGVDPQKVAPFWNKAQEVKQLSKELEAYIHEVRNQVIMETEKVLPEVADTIHLEYLTKKDDYDTPTNIMIGESQDGSAGLSGSLRKKIDGYRNRLLSLLDEKDRDLEKLGLETGKTVKINGVDYNWEMNNFYHTPLAATVTILTQVQADIKNAEYYVISKLIEEFKTDEIPFDTVAAKVIAQSSYVLLGDEYKAGVFLAAYSKTQQPGIYIGEPDTASGLLVTVSDTVNVTNGVGNYTVKTDREGIYRYNGMIEMINPDGKKKQYPFQSEYIVARPNLVVSPDKMNVFYKGPVNPVSVSVPGVASENLVVGITGGNTIRKVSNGKYEVNITRNSPQQVFINVSAKMPDGTEQRMPPMEFRAKNMPQPYVKIRDIKGSGKMRKEDLAIQQGIKAEYDPTFEFNLPIAVKSYAVEYASRGTVTPAKRYAGNKFNNEFKTAVSMLKAGDRVTFSEIQAENSIGQPYTMSPIIIEVF